jgi:alkyl hydroperoxide reductase subunit AhpC
VCPTELVAFSEAMSKFRELNTAVAAMSTDSHHSHLAWIRTPRKDGGVGSLNFPLLADISKRISRSYGVLVEDENDGMQRIEGEGGTTNKVCSDFSH